MAEDHGLRKFLTSGYNSSQKIGSLRIRQMVSAVGIEIFSQQNQVMVGLHEDEIGIDKMLYEVVPLTNIGRNNNFLVEAANIKTESRIPGIVNNLKRTNQKVPDFERGIIKRPYVKPPEAIFFKMVLFEREDVIIVNIKRKIVFFEYSQRVIRYMVAVNMAYQYGGDR